ncbi:MAG: DUF3185 family protein [Treponema sp.]|nr:DUF3185 family protein [Treponema sp.]
MGSYIQVLALIIAGIVLLWFGYSLFFGPLSPFYPGRLSWKSWKKKGNIKGEAGDPQICPVCCIKLDRGELVKSIAFPSMTGGRDRLMYINGCFSCLNNRLPRRCPVCGSRLSVSDYLISRMFERSNRRNHVHVLGCNQCRRTGSLAR